MANSSVAVALQIEPLEPCHASGVAPLSVEAGWNQIAADWELMLSEGRGFGVRDRSGRWTASALVLPLGPAISWISMVLVTKSARRGGLGGRLLRRCLAEFDGSAGAVGLDATELGRPVYLPLGFRDVYPLSRWRAEADARHPTNAPPDVRLRPATPADLHEIATLDRAHTGFTRPSILASLLARAPELAHVALRIDDQLVGYSLGRDGHSAMHVGPVVAQSEAIGLALLARAMSSTSMPVIVDIPDRHEAVRTWLGAQGASAPRSFMRMLRGDCTPVEDASAVFALAGPELA